MLKQLVPRGVIRCPETGGDLAFLEPWLLASEEDGLYPVVAGTPVLQPQCHVFLQEQIWNVCRVLAEWPDKSGVRDWYFSRYRSLATPEPPPQDTMVHGEGFPGFWNAVASPAFIRDQLEPTPEARLEGFLGERTFALGLDLGCGQGGMMQRMAARCSRVLGLETNLYLAALANQQLRSNELTVRYFDPTRGGQVATLPKTPAPKALAVCGDVRFMPFGERSFDWIHCGHFLDLIDEPLAVLAQVTHLLKPGGCLTIATPWDFEKAGHFAGMNELLSTYYDELGCQDGVPWFRFNHRRRLVLHEDWIWAGNKRR